MAAELMVLGISDKIGRGEAGRLHPVPDQGGGGRGVRGHRGRRHLRQVARRRALAPGAFTIASPGDRADPSTPSDVGPSIR